MLSHSKPYSIVRRMSFVLLAVLFTLSSCSDKVVEKLSYTANVPIYMTAEELKGSLKSETARPLVNPGKIHIKNGILYIVEQYEGIHVIDNSNPASPKAISFIKIPGVVDVASKGNVMYADSYTDLVALDISDPFNVTELNRALDVFTQNQSFWTSLPPTNNDYPMGTIDPEKGIVVGWTVEEITEEYEVNNNWRCWNCQVDFATTWEGGFTNDAGASPTSLPSNGQSGSMARFTVYQDALYTLDRFDLKVFNTSDAISPSLVNTINTNLEVETLFNLGENLFIGTTTGMMIYSLADPNAPTHTSTFAHVRSCDPVVVEGTTAYVTLRSGNECAGFTNQLDVLDVEDLANPELLISYNMTNPHGLGIDNGVLFICDGDAGLRVFDATDRLTISANPLAHFPEINAYDVIPLGNVLLTIGKDGFYQYDYSDVTNIHLVSSIPVIQSVI